MSLWRANGNDAPWVTYDIRERELRLLPGPRLGTHSIALSIRPLCVVLFLGLATVPPNMCSTLNPTFFRIAVVIRVTKTVFIYSKPITYSR